jgi:hypothetical protein
VSQWHNVDLEAVSEAFEASQLQIAGPLDAISKRCAVTRDLNWQAEKNDA